MDLLEQLFALYRDAFPASERRDESDLRQALATPAYRILTKDDRGQLLGFAILFVPLGKTFALLEYLAVDPDRRGEGIGRDLVLSAIQQAGGRTLLSEIECESNESATTLGRQRFYRRCGFSRIDGLPYQLPLPGNPPLMELWIYQASPVPIERDALALWLSTIYAEVYHCASDDPRIAQMLATFSDTD
jgi:GNAT superfamily N-acetyltransferase